MGYVPTRPPPMWSSLCEPVPSGTREEVAAGWLAAIERWGTPVVSVTGDPADRKRVLDQLRMDQHFFVFDAHRPDAEIKFLTAGATGCDYCGRLRSGAATCEGCGAPRMGTR